MQRNLIAFIAMASGLAACGGTATNNTTASLARACTPPRSHWLPQGPLNVGVSAPTNRISLDRNAAIYWNGQPTTLPRLQEYLSLIATLEPEPVTFLDTEMGTPCALVEGVRDEMDRRLHCGAEGLCAEGVWKVWQATPIPPGTPPS